MERELTDELYSTTDARVWAQYFVDIITTPECEGADPTDVGFMIGWFAAAIETGKNHSRHG